MHARDAHRAGLARTARRRELAQGEHAPADAVLGLEDEWLVALARELEGRHEPGHPAPMTITLLRSPRRSPRPVEAVRRRSGGVGGAAAGLGGPWSGIAQR